MNVKSKPASATASRPCGCPRCERMADNLEKLRLDWERFGGNETNHKKTTRR